MRRKKGLRIVLALQDTSHAPLDLLAGLHHPISHGMPGVWKHPHRLLLCWRIVLQGVYPGRKTLEERQRWSPKAITAWRFRRVLKAAYWNVHLRIAWLADDVIKILPAPADGPRRGVGFGF
jgi:hypothetical protein